MIEMYFQCLTKMKLWKIIINFHLRLDFMIAHGFRLPPLSTSPVALDDIISSSACSSLNDLISASSNTTTTTPPITTPTPIADDSNNNNDNNSMAFPSSPTPTFIPPTKKAVTQKLLYNQRYYHYVLNAAHHLFPQQPKPLKDILFLLLDMTPLPITIPELHAQILDGMGKIGR